MRRSSDCSHGQSHPPRAAACY